MKRLDYFRYALKNTLPFKLDWVYTFFTCMPIPSKLPDDNILVKEYIKVDFNNREVYVKVDNEYVILEDYQFDINSPVFNKEMAISLTEEEIVNIDKIVETKLGRALFNYIVLARNFGKLIPYINEKTSIGAIEDIIADKMYKNEITSDQYVKFTDSVIFIESLSRVFVIAATEKNIVPPPNIDKIKKDLLVEFDNKYGGKEWRRDVIKVTEFEDRLKKIDNEWLADDPTLGKILNKKVKDNARVKMFLVNVPGAGFKGNDGSAVLIENSLNEGFPKDKEKLSAVFNDSRHGSYSRGKETQKGGAAAKDILRATSNISIVEGDCGAKIGKKVTVLPNLANSYKGRYIIDSSRKLVQIEDPKQYIGKTIEIRSPMTCKTKDGKLCSICVGKSVANFKTGISLMVTAISGELLTVSLKSMHAKNQQIKNIDISKIMF